MENATENLLLINYSHIGHKLFQQEFLLLLVIFEFYFYL